MKISEILEKYVSGTGQDVSDKMLNEGIKILQDLMKDVNEIAKQYFVENGNKIISEVAAGTLPVFGDCMY